MKKIILLILFFYVKISSAQTTQITFPFKNFDLNAAPRTQLSSMSIKLFDDYRTYRPSPATAPDNNSYGTVLAIYGRPGHWEHNLYFGANKKMYFRTSTWSSGGSENGIGAFNNWRTILDSYSDIESKGLLKLTGTGNHYLKEGNLGIGTINPSGKLDVNGSLIVNTKQSPYTHIQIGHDKNDMIISDNTTEKYYGGGYFFRVHNENIPDKYIDALTISTTGDIGINTSNTKGYKLAIVGKAIAEEVVVKLRNSWPDYVFENNYDLPSLEEVEKHIKEKGHLEDIPTAKKVAENGIQLGEMNKKLLQKIEELTLYTIQQEKRIKKIEIENSELKKQNEKIKTLEEKINFLLKKTE